MLEEAIGWYQEGVVVSADFASTSCSIFGSILQQPIRLFQSLLHSVISVAFGRSHSELVSRGSRGNFVEV